MSELSKQEQEQLVRQIYSYAADLMRQGYSRTQIVKELESKGIEREVAHTIWERLDGMRNSGQRGEAFKAMGIGAVICLIGIVVTMATYSSAKGGGTYVVAYGAILGGGFQFLRGVYYLMS